MKIALVCDDLVQRGGQENVVEAISEIWPDADIYTSIATKYWINKYNSKGVKVFTSFMQVLPFKVKLNRFYSVFLLHILGIESFNFKNFDLVISISSRYAHHAITRPDQIHVCYLNSPGRMFWEPSSYFTTLEKKILEPVLSFFRIADYAASRRVDYIITNSSVSQNRAKKYLRRDSTLLYPFVDTDSLVYIGTLPAAVGDYYLVITRLVPWKRVEIAIEACKKLGVPLKIIGEGPDTARLQKLADHNIELMGYVDAETKTKTLYGCKALINTQLEDFGIVPLEAMAVGRPVIAFGRGGATETVIEGKTGIFFEEQTPESLCNAIRKFEQKKFMEKDCIDRAKEFSKEEFQKKIKKLVENLTGKNI